MARFRRLQPVRFRLEIAGRDSRDYSDLDEAVQQGFALSRNGVECRLVEVNESVRSRWIPVIVDSTSTT